MLKEKACSKAAQMLRKGNRGDILTGKIYLTDAYARDLKTRVISVSRKGAGNTSLWELELEDTIFYPGGGGQPADTGNLSSNGWKANVSKIEKTGTKWDYSILHVLEAEPRVKANDEVNCTIDWDRRYTYMRHHTAIHVIGGIMEEKYKAKFTGGQIGLDVSRFDFDMPALNRKLAQQIVDESQNVINKGLSVLVKSMAKEDALKMPNIARTIPGTEGLQSLNEIRLVEIESFDIQMDGGTHVKNTREIGEVSLINFENKGAHRKRIEITLGNTTVP